MRTNNTTLQAHADKLQYEHTIPVSKHHKILVYSIVGSSTLIYVPSFYRDGIWYSYSVNGKSFATYVPENARRLVAGKR